MATILEQIPARGRVLIVRLRSLGDCVLTTPAISLLKQSRPDLRIGVVVEERFRAVFEGKPDLDEIFAPAVAPVARFRPHLTVNFHGGTRSMALTAASAARFRAGFGHYRATGLYNVLIPRAQEILNVERTVHTAEHLASAMFHLGVSPGEIPRAKLFAKRTANPRPYAVLHPVASAPDKTWPATSFLRTAAHLVAQGLEPIFIGAASDDLAAFSHYRTVAGAPLDEVKDLIASAILFAGNDSGPAHMAAAFGLPVAVVFGASDPEIWRPWKTESVVLMSAEGIAAVPPEQMIEAVDRLRVAA